VARVSEPVLALRDPQRPSWPVAVQNSTPPDLIALTRFIPNGSLMGASGCGPPQERSAIPFTFAGYDADRSVMRGDHLRALDVALSADLRQRPGVPLRPSP
jgi:hypothetical protein